MEVDETKPLERESPHDHAGNMPRIADHWLHDHVSIGLDFRIVPHTLISLEYLIEGVRYLR